MSLINIPITIHYLRKFIPNIYENISHIILLLLLL